MAEQEYKCTANPLITQIELVKYTSCIVNPEEKEAYILDEDLSDFLLR